MTTLQEKDFNLRKEYARFGSEVRTHTYNFERQAQELKELESITKADLQAHFEKVYFSDTTKRMDVELTAEAHKEENTEYFEKNKDCEIFKEL